MNRRVKNVVPTGLIQINVSSFSLGRTITTAGERSTFNVGSLQGGRDGKMKILRLSNIGHRLKSVLAYRTGRAPESRNQL